MTEVSNFDGHFTNALLNEMIGEGIDDDGLPMVNTNHKVSWPFEGCVHKGWHANRTRRIMAFNTGACFCIPTEIHHKTELALEKHKEGTPEALKSALNIYRSVLDVKISKDSVATDTFLRSIAMTNVGILLSVRQPTQQQPKKC